MIYLFFFFLDISTRMSFGQTRRNISKTDFSIFYFQTFSFTRIPSSVNSILAISICSNLGVILNFSLSFIIRLPVSHQIIQVCLSHFFPFPLSLLFSEWLSSHLDYWERQQSSVKNTGSGVRLPFTSFVNLGELLIFSVPQFSHLKKWG